MQQKQNKKRIIIIHLSRFLSPPPPPLSSWQGTPSRPHFVCSLPPTTKVTEFSFNFFLNTVGGGWWCLRRLFNMFPIFEITLGHSNMSFVSLINWLNLIYIKTKPTERKQMKSSRVLGLWTHRVSQLHHHQGTFDISQRIASIGNLFNQHNKKRQIFKYLSRFFL
jgi:hypothetical protein